MKKTRKQNRAVDLIHKKYLLPATVFLTGAAVLVIEIAGIRVLAPYYGNTMFSVSSVLSVVLAALSLGYYLGGRVSDKYPSHELFFGIITAGGGAVLFMHILMRSVLPVMGYDFSPRTGPLVFSMTLFFIPAMLLGMLSPFAITLQKRMFSGLGVGVVSGTIFLWSTLGSIVGSLAAGFILIPHLGVSTIMLMTGLILFALGIIPVALFRSQAGRGVKILLVICLPVIVMLFPYADAAEGRYLYAADGLYQKIVIFDTVLDNHPVRLMLYDRLAQGGMRLDSPEHAFSYTRYFQLYELVDLAPKRVYVIGGAAYTIPKAYASALDAAQIDVTDIEPAVTRLAEKYFNLENSPRIRSYIMDGRRFLHDADQPYDVIYSDAYGSVISIPYHFTTKEFFELAKSKLTQEGIFIANIIGSLQHDKRSFLWSELRTFRSVFPNSYFYAVNGPDHQGGQNVIFLGVKDAQKKIAPEDYLKDGVHEFIRAAADQQIAYSDNDVRAYPILTDDYAPVDYLTSKLIR